jgi:tartrate-resistant acid phosphatase type 5
MKAKNFLRILWLGFGIMLSQFITGSYAMIVADNSTILFIDPTTTPLPNSIYTFDPIADATIRQDLPNSNYGSATTLQTDNSPVKNFLLKFSVTGVSNRQIVKATLRLYDIDPSSKGGDFHAMTDTTWNEGTVNWNNAPAADPAIIASLGAVTVNNWYEVDVTALIQADGLHSLRITSTASDGADYDSREGANPPQLILEVSNNATLTPTVTSIYSSTPTLSPTPTLMPTLTPTRTQTFTPAPSATLLPGGYMRFAVIGDYGSGNQAEADVAALVKSWNPEFIVTVGDNNYPLGDASTIDNNIGKYYHEFIYPYTGSFGAGASYNRFFPALGNHDWDTGNVQAHLDYFTLPGNERYYDFTQGSVHFFIIDSDPREPDGNTSTSTQAVWLQNQLAASTSTWNIVVMHHTPYSSGLEHGSHAHLQWPYAAWGADIVLSGHDHEYERLLVSGLPYIVNGLGGASIYVFSTPLPESQVRYNADYGALLVEANSTQLNFSFHSRSSILIDTYTIDAGSPATETATATLVTPTETILPDDTATESATPTLTPSETVLSTPTKTYTATLTPVNILTATTTFTPTFTPTATATNTPTRTNTPSPTFTRTSTPSHTATHTAVPPTSTNTSTPTARDVIYISSTSGGTVGGVTFAAEDILKFDTIAKTWALHFDGSDVGLSSSSGTVVDAFCLMSDGSILLSLINAATIPNLGSVDDSDIVRFIPTSLGTNTAGSFAWYFDGSDVGLTASGENIDVIGFAPDGRLILSTTGSLSVTGASGEDEDLAAFSSTSLGANTTGTWSLYFDGSDVSLSTSSSEDINGASIDPITGRIHLTTVGSFSVTGVSGSGADIFVCTPGSLGSNTTCTYSSYWVGSQNGFGGEIADGVNVIKQ